MLVIRQAMGESRMQRKLPVRFGGGWAETGSNILYGAALPPYARRMLSNGADLAEVKRVLGHSRITTTQRYTEPSEDEIRGAIGRAGV